MHSCVTLGGDAIDLSNDGAVRASGKSESFVEVSTSKKDIRRGFGASTPRETDLLDFGDDPVSGRRRRRLIRRDGSFDPLGMGWVQRRFDQGRNLSSRPAPPFPIISS